MEVYYESSLGGLVNVITPSGSNEFYGVAFGFFNNDRISGNEISIGEPPKSSFIRTDAGLGIGGPIIQDRLWFYAAFDAQYNSVQVSLSNLGDQNFATTGNLFAGKLTWLVNNSNKIDLVVFGDPRYGDGYLNYPLNATFDENFNFKPYIYDANYHALAQGNHTLGKNSFLESYINFSRFLSKQNTENPNGMTEPLYYDLTTNTISGDVTWTDWRSDEIKLGLKGTHISGNHLIKAGIEYLNSTRFDKTDYNEIDKYGDSSFVQIIYTTDTKVTYRIPTLFLQDSWSISSYFRLNAGARWNYVFMVGSDGKVAQTIPDQIAPRLGIMFLPDGDNRQMISLSAGRFYHTFPAMLLTSYYSENSYSSAAFFTEDPRNEGAEGEVFYEPRAEIYPKIDNLKGPHYDEITIGYERELPLNLLGNIKLIYRTLVDGIEDGVDPETGELVLGNPGKGDMSAFPKMQRDYIAFEIVLSSNITTNYNFQVSYILSRLYGNYTGFYDTESGMYGPINPQYDSPEQLVNATGLLPHDRTHTLKFFGSYYFDFGLSLGTSFFIATGKPLSIIGGHSSGPPYYTFLEQRGTNGRTPTVWDWNIRLSYELNRLFGLNNKIRLLADLYHIASDKAPVDYDEVKYFNKDAEGNQINLNPDYNQPIRYQPPMSLRLGLEIGF